MAGNSLDYNRLIFLTQRIKDHTASKAETDEYMRMLYQNGNITQQQYNNYISAGAVNPDEVVKAALVIGGILLVTYLLSNIFKS